MKPRIKWLDPIYPAVCMTFMTVTAYGGLRGDDPLAMLSACSWLWLAWADRYLTGEKEKALPRQGYLADPLPRLR